MECRDSPQARKRPGAGPDGDPGLVLSCDTRDGKNRAEEKSS